MRIFPGYTASRVPYAIGLSLLGLGLVVVVYWSGLHGGFLFDDFPNIVDNPAVQPQAWTWSNLVRAAFSSPSSDLKRPLASLSFAANFLISGLDPFGFKLTNLIIHLANGILVAVLTRKIMVIARPDGMRNDLVAAAVALGWLLLPINLTAVLYVVQRMESLANLFVLAGLVGYLHGRTRALETASGTWVAMGSIIAFGAMGVLAKETAVMLPAYAACLEWILIRPMARFDDPKRRRQLDYFFLAILVVPGLVAACMVVPGLFNPLRWSHRDFTLSTRLLTEMRVIVAYVKWTIVPAPNDLSFYHDDLRISTSLVSPLTTLLSGIALIALIAAGWRFRRFPLVPLAIAFYLVCHLLTGTVLPLELVYEHRNYFASFGVLLLLVPPLIDTASLQRSSMWLRGMVIVGLLTWWTVLTAATAWSWGEPLRLAEELAWRGKASPRAQYELGREYVIYSQYEPTSRFAKLAYPPLERAAALPGSTILPEQALIFFNSRMRLPIKDAWWQSMLTKLSTRLPGVQDESSLDALSQCAIDKRCDLDAEKMTAAFDAAMAHPTQSARLAAIYGNYLWNGLDRDDAAIAMLKHAVDTEPNEPAYHLTLGRMYAGSNRKEDANRQLDALRRLNYAGRADDDIKSLAETIRSPTSE